MAGRLRNDERGRAAAVLALALTVCGCGGIRQLPLGTNSFTTSRVSVEEALEVDDVDRAVERAHLFARRFPGEVASGLLGVALWRSGRLNEAEGHLRRAAEAGDERGSLGMARVAISRAHWDRARRWAEAAGGGREARALLLTVALASRDEAAAREAAAALAEGASGEETRLARLAAMIVDGGLPGGWRGEPGVVPVRAATDGLLVQARFSDRPVRLRLALDGHRSWIRRELVADAAGASASREEPDAGASVVVGTMVLGPVRRQGVVLEARPAAGSGEGERAALPAAVDGELAADLLADLRWSLDPAAGRLVVAPAAGRGWDAPEPLTPEAREVLRPPTGEDIQWLSVRVLREGLDVQWFLMPRIEARAMSAVVDWRRGSRIDDDALEELGLEADESGAAVQARLGAWWPSVRLAVADLAPRAAGGRVAPRLSMGPDVLSGRRLLWDPGTRQLGLVPEATTVGGLQ